MERIANEKIKFPPDFNATTSSFAKGFQKPVMFSSAPSYDLLSTSPYSIVQHRLANLSEKCKISMQDKRIKTGTIPRGNPAVTPFAADESASGLQTFECDLFDLLSNAPSAPLCTAYSSL